MEPTWAKQRSRARLRTAMTLSIALALIASACTDASDATASEDSPADSGDLIENGTATTDEPAGSGTCDDTDDAQCLLPWPSDSFTRTVSDTPTGLRVDLPADGTPTNVEGVRIDPTEWNRNDGFSPASIPQTVIPDLDIDASDLPPQSDIGASLDSESNLVLVDMDTGDRVPAWAEIDINVTDPDRTLLRIIPATALKESHRHAVGLWNLVTSDGSEVQPDESFASIVTDPDSGQAEWLQSLGDVGQPIEDLDLGWSFTVASSDSLTGRLRHMWAETSDDLGVDPGGERSAGGAPPFTVTSSETEGSVRFVEGTFDMPKYLTGDGGPGSVFNNDDSPNGIPVAEGTMEAPFVCIMPVDSEQPVPFVIYGHGLLGDRYQVDGLGSLGASVGVGFCALDFIGMSGDDVPTILEEFEDLSLFRTQADRLQQGHLGFALLGRLLASAEGFSADPAFQSADGSSIILPEGISYLGASQGGILGGPSTAISPDWSRAIFAVGGMGYNLLLRRSVDLDEFLPVIEESYPNELDQALALELIEQLWDRGENAGWAQHLTEDPFPEGGDATTVLLLEAFGDHQVANVSTEKLARTINALLREPALADGRSTDSEPFFGLEPIESFPFDGSALVVWDFGTPPPPAANTPPREGDDPHGKLGDEPQALALVVAFAQPNGMLIDVCGAQPCASPG